MKKWMLVLVALFVSVSAFSQSCLDDVWQCLKANQIPKAKKFMESCMAENPDNAAVWLMQANVNINLYNYDLERQKKDPSVAPRYPNALEDAYAAFLKAVELDKNVMPKTGMLGAQDGQKLLADPFKDKAALAEEKGKYDEALKYYDLAAKCYELGGLKTNAAAMCYYSANVYVTMKDNANSTKMLEKCISMSPSITPAAYDVLYYNYKDLNDTVKCGEILSKAQKIFGEDPEKIAMLYAPIMDYYSMIGDQEKLLAMCDKAIATGKTEMITRSATYLSNAKAYAKAEEILKDALAKDPKNFDLLKQMAYRYALEYYDLMDQRKVAMDSRRYEDANKIYQGPERKAAMENAHEWAQKAYEQNSDDLDNNLILREMKTLLQLEVPQELNDKINARIQK
jgi:tetratricopeptide (TPR) repeat protein